MFVLRPYGSFVPMRMNKSANQSVGASVTDGQVTGWVADGGYPGTVIDTNRLKVTAGSGKSIDAAVAWTGTSPWNKSAKLFKNGVQIGTTQSSTTASGTFNFNLTNQTLADGDLLELKVTTSSTGITVLAAGTFIRVQD